MKLTENQLEWIQDKVRDEVSDKFRETILKCAKAIKNNDINHENIGFEVREDTVDVLFSRACDDIIDQVFAQHKW
jgi:hypothetical protein